MHSAIWVGVAAMILAACVQDSAPSYALAGKDACRADALQYLVGQPLAAAKKLQIAEPVRWIAPFSRVTKDYLPARVNIVYDAGEIITAVHCG
jgi:hypothetical protein